ncbi:MAG TPA: hypothetical protein VLS44_10790 [Nitrospira sp.]|nr:hypothetical protein [Nitrospira sp.]
MGNAQKIEWMIFSIVIRFSLRDVGAPFTTTEIPYVTADAAAVTGYRNDEVE